MRLRRRGGERGGGKGRRREEVGGGGGRREGRREETHNELSTDTQRVWERDETSWQFPQFLFPLQ